MCPKVMDQLTTVYSITNAKANLLAASILLMLRAAAVALCRDERVG